MSASTKTASLDPHSLEEAARNWQILPTEGVSPSNKVLASLINLAHAHFMHGKPDFSAEISQTLQSLLHTHCTKMRPHYIMNGDVKQTPKIRQDIQTYAKEMVNATPMQEQSALQKEITPLLNWYVLTKSPTLYQFKIF